MNENERAMHPGITGSRNNEVGLRWQRNAMFILIHSTGFSFILIHPSTILLTAIIGFLGMVLSGFWIVTNWKTQKWVRFWHKCLEEMENDEEDPLRVKVYSSARFKKVNNKFPTFHQILTSLSVLALAGWFGVFVTALTRLARGGV